MLAKNLLPEVHASQLQNCGEFSHIHLTHFESASDLTWTTSDHEGADQTHSECEGGQAIFGIAELPSPPSLNVRIQTFAFEVAQRIQSHFKSPFLDQLRRPPKFLS